MGLVALLDQLFRADLGTDDSGHGDHRLGGSSQFARYFHVAERYVQSLAMGLATTLADSLITLDGSGRIVGYPLVGYVAVAANLLAIWFVSRIVMHGRHA